jgi:hypothetical protein
MKRDGCERSWQVDAVREGRLGARDAESFERHRRTCADCARRMVEDEKLGELTRALPDDGPSELALRRLRTRVLRDVATGVVPRERRVPPRAVVGLVVLGAAVMAGAWAIVGPREAPLAPARVAASDGVRASAEAPLAGEVVPSSGARWTQVREVGLEQLRLDDGTLHVHVRPQQLGERFLVSLPDGEIEVRGTTFDVTVESGATRRVHVDDGIVELRLRDLPPRAVVGGDTWTATPAMREEPAALVVRPAPVSAPRPSASSPPAAPATAEDGTAAYAAAMARLRAGDNEDAASAFHAFVLAYPRSSMAEDASFLEAVALARSGRADAAALAAEHHLASYPRSFHSKDAAVLVARASSSRGDCAKARAVLAPWIDSTDDDVRAALRTCL